MEIVGCDLHRRYQQIAMLDDETGEMMERRQAARSRIPVHVAGCRGEQGFG